MQQIGEPWFELRGLEFIILLASLIYMTALPHFYKSCVIRTQSRQVEDDVQDKLVEMTNPWLLVNRHLLGFSKTKANQDLRFKWDHCAV